MRKKDVTSSVTKIGETVKIIQNAAARGSSGGNNMVVIGYNTAGACHITNAEKALDKLEKWINKIQFLHEQVDFQFPGKFTEEVKQKLNKLEEDMQTYRSKVSDMVNSSVEHFRSETSAPASASSLRGNSPIRKQFVNMKHLMPETLTSECSMSEYCKFKHDFSAWVEASYLDVYSPSELRSAFMSRADAGWQQRADTTQGLETLNNPAALCNHCDSIMLFLQFSGTKLDKGMTLSVHSWAGMVFVKFYILKNPKRMRVLICEEEADEILIDIQSLVDWSNLPPNFPEPQDPKEKVRLTKTVPKIRLVKIKRSGWLRKYFNKVS